MLVAGEKKRPDRLFIATYHVLRSEVRAVSSFHFKCT